MPYYFKPHPTEDMKPQHHVRFDWAMKRLLRQKANFEILEGFLSELLHEDVLIQEILESESNQISFMGKHNRVDLLVKNSKGELIIIEIQNAYSLDYFHRILYGISKAITEFFHRGEAYSKVSKIISVNIVYFDIGQGSDYLYKGTTSFKGLHTGGTLGLTQAQRAFFDKKTVEEIYPEIYLIKINNFNNHAKDSLDEWIYFLKNSRIKKDFTAKGLQKANKTLVIANLPQHERWSHEDFLDVLSDKKSEAESLEQEAKILAKKLVKEQTQAIQEATQKQLEERTQAMQEATQKQLEEQTQASQQKLETRILNLLKLGALSEEQIAETMQVDLALIQRIKSQL